MRGSASTWCWRAHNGSHGARRCHGRRKSHLCFTSIPDQQQQRNQLYYRSRTCLHDRDGGRYLKKDLVAHCDTSLSQAALEHARIRAVAQACSSLTVNFQSSDDIRSIQVKAMTEEGRLRSRNTLCSLKNRSISSLSPPAQLTSRWRSWSTGRSF